MNDTPDNSTQRVEDLLRRWGADEAAGDAKVPPAPAPQRAADRAPRRPTWGYLAAAAAGIIVAAGGFYLVHRNARAELDRTRALLAEKDREAADADGAMAALETDLARARTELRSARLTLEQARTKLSALAEDDKAATARLARLEEQSRKRQEELADAKRLSAELRGSLGEKQAALASARKALGNLDQTKAALADAAKKVERLEGELAGQHSRLAAANSEISRATGRSQQALAARRKVETELSQLKARQEAILASYQRAYLSAAAPGLEPTRAMSQGEAALLPRQVAARRNQMLQRHARLRASLRSESAGRLFETLEVLLTRLDMLDPGDPYSVRSFQALIRQSSLAERIDEVLADVGEPAEVRAWLMEARLILTGAERV